MKTEVRILDSDADKILLYALGAWMISWVHPILGLLAQFPAIIYIVCKCNIKYLPALMILMLGKSNLRIWGVHEEFAIRFFITWTSSSCFSIAVFIFAIRNILLGKYDRSASYMAILWILSIVPALVMSLNAKANGLAGIWSGPIMDFLIPGIYYWGISMGRTYADGRHYFCQRMMIICVAVLMLIAIRVFAVHTFFVGAMVFCLSIYFIGSGAKLSIRILALIGILLAFYCTIFARGHAIEMRALADYSAEELKEADRYGSSFSGMATPLCAIILSMGVARWFGRQFLRALPILMVVFNVLLVSWVISTQAGNKHKDVSQKYESVMERFEYKLFGDRANVWSMGWEEMKTPPYVFKDLRQFCVYSNGGMGMKLMPHNQFITLLARQGFWLGLFLSLFIIWVWVRAFKAMTFCMDDLLINKVFVPVGAAIYFIVGLSGQGVVSGVLWGDALACIVMPGIVYGSWVERKKQRIVTQGYRGCW